MNRRTVGVAAVAGYVGTVLLANWLSTEYGLVPVGFGLMVSAGTYAAGLALGLRDLVQDTLGRLMVLGAIVVGAALSYSVASAAIATASAVAFLCSELADMSVYTPLKERGASRRAVVASNAVGATVDTLLFLWISGFGITAEAFWGQMLAKAVWITAVYLVARELGIRAWNSALFGEPDRRDA